MMYSLRKLAKKLFSLPFILWIVLLLACHETVNDMKSPDDLNQSVSSPETSVQFKPEKRPVVLKQGEPYYPQEARKSGIEGMVVVKVLVDTLGNVEKIEIVKSIPELDQAAMAAAREFKFKAATLNDKKVSSWVTIPFHFKLRDDK